MSRSHVLAPLILLLALALSGCPVDDDDDSSAPPLDDDDAADPCEGFADVTSSIDSGTVVSGDTSTETDDYTGSCSNAAVAETVFVFVAPEDATYLVSTQVPETLYDTLLFAFSDCEDAEGSEIACNDDIVLGEVFESEILFDAAAGDTVYIAVEGYDGVGAFGLTLSTVTCGDGIVSGAELCDDGGEEAGDGCDENCVWECDLEDANEDDDTVATATDLALPATVDGFLCTTDISPDFDPVYIDLFAVTLTEEAAFLDVSAAPGGTVTTDCADQTLTLLLLDADVTNLGGSDAAEGECARVVAELGPGSFYVAVFGDDPRLPPQDYELSVTSGVSVCGDGTEEGIEECDDGGVDPGDGCTPGCLLEETCTIEDPDLSDLLDGDSLTGATVEGGADDHDPSCGAVGSPDITFLFTAAADGPVVFSLNNPGTDFDTTLYIRSNCGDSDSEITCADDVDGENRTSVVGLEAVEGTDYAVVVDGWGGEFGTFELTVVTPECGDGIVDATEECDDANDTPEDGCEADCRVTPACAYDADVALGVIVGPDPHLASVETLDDDVTDASCSDAGGGDALVSFEIATGGTTNFAVSLADGVDAQFQLWGPADACGAIGECFDPYPDPSGSFDAELEPGLYYLVVDAWNGDFEGAVDVTITVPSGL